LNSNFQIIFQCFEPLFRLKRSIRDEEDPLNEKPVIIEDKSGESLAEFFDQEYKKADQVKKSVALFTDRVGICSIFGISGSTNV
jgi:hypothetical protein